jgi:anti-sigma factor RsiW
MNTERIPLSDKELWQAFASGRPVAPAAVSDMDFAAWLEGNLSETEAAHIEAAVATHPEMRRAAVELADILGKPLPAVPARLAVRAQALVGFEAERQAPRRSRFASFLPSFELQRGVMAAAAILVAAMGFMMGGGLGETYAEQKYASTTTVQQPLGTDTTNELNDLFADNT